MHKLHIALSMTILLPLFAGCGGSDSPAIGTGDPISSLSPEASAQEFIDSMVLGLAEGSFFVITELPASPNLSTTGLQSAAISNSEKNTLDCPGGGTRVLTSTYTITEIANNEPAAGSANLRFVYNDCKITMDLPAGQFTETLDGVSQGEISFGNHSFSSRTHIGISGSGDLGFALECSLSRSGSFTSFADTWSGPLSGTCSISDSEGVALTLDVEQ